MRTSGAGSEGLLIVASALVLIAVGILIEGSPSAFFQSLDRFLQQAVGGAVEWVRARV